MTAALLRRKASLVTVAALAAAAVTAGVFGAGPSSAATTPPPPEPGIAPASTSIGTSLAPATVLAYTATGGSVWLKDLTTGASVAAGGHLISGPSVFTSDGTDIVVAGRGTNSAVWMTTCSMSAGCGAWSSAGGVITSRPAAAIEDSGDTAVLARGANGALWARHHDPTTGWGAWTSYGGRLLAGTGPAIANHDPDVLVVGTNKEVYYVLDGTSSFNAIAGQTTASPGLTTVYAIDAYGQATAQEVAFVRGTDGAAWYNLFLSDPQGWHSMGGSFTSGLGASTAVAANAKSTVPTSTFGVTASDQVDESDGTWTAWPPTFTGWTPVG